MLEDPRIIKARKEYLGNFYKTRDGKEFKVIEYNSYGDVTVEFIESGYKIHTSMSNILNGQVANPFAKSVIAFDSPEQSVLGCLFPTNNSCMIKIIGFKSMREVTYQFQDEFGYIGTTTIQNIRKGQIHNPYKRSELDRSYIGEGPYDCPRYSNLKTLWKSFCIKATGSKVKYNKTVTVNISVCDDFLCYNKFADWYLNTIVKLNPDYLYSIDKFTMYKYYRTQTEDMFFYCPETVELIPDDLAVKIQNTITLGTSTQLDTLLNLTEKYYSEKALTQRAYFAIKDQYTNENHWINIIIPSYHLQYLHINDIGRKMICEI